MLRRIIDALAFAVGIAVVSPSWAANEWQATPSEGVLLPKFCWGQTMKLNEGSAEFWIPRTCGPYVNHYCLGLLKIVRANKVVGNMGQKRMLYRQAKDDTEYTLRGMEPGCPIREHAEATMKKIDSMLKIMQH